MIYLFITLIILLIIFIIYLIFIYSKLNKIKNNIDLEYYNIIINYKKRNDLIPKILVVLRNNFKKKKEKELLDNITILKNKLIDSKERSEIINADQELSIAIKEAIDNCHNYPSILEEATYNELKNELEEIDKDLKKQRQSYNEVVSEFNSILNEPLTKICNYILKFKEENLFNKEVNDAV